MSGRFQYDPRDEIKMQTESDAVQPCKLYFGELGTGGQAGMQWVEDRGKEKKMKEREKERKGQCQTTRAGEERSAREIGYHHHGSRDAYLAQSLCRRRGSSEEGFQENSGEKEKAPQESMCCPFIVVFAHAQGVFAYAQFVPYVLPA